MGQHYPRNIFNSELFPNYGILLISLSCKIMAYYSQTGFYDMLSSEAMPTNYINLPQHNCYMNKVKSHRVYLTNHRVHITLLVIYHLRGGHTHTHTNTFQEVISRSQAHTSLAHTQFRVLPFIAQLLDSRSKG